MRIQKPLLGRIGWFIVMITLAALLSIGMAQQLGAQGSDNDMIHACVRDSTRVVIIIEVNDLCPQNWTSMEWNIQGFKGAIGPAGAVGPAGDQGGGNVLSVAALIVAIVALVGSGGIFVMSRRPT